MPCLLLFVLGCGDNSRPAVTYQYHPGKGKVLVRGQPMTGGRIQFTPDDPNFTTSADIQPDGAFALTTVVANPHARVDGAPAGEYTVSVMTPEMLGQAGPPMIFPGKVVLQANGPDIDLDFP